MPGPQSPFPPPGPSPYYHPPPPHIPPYSYTNLPAPYPYQYPPPPVNGHSPTPPSPRVSGRGGYHGTPRGGPGPNFAQNYLHHPHPHPHHPPSHTSFIPQVPMHHSPQPSPNAYPNHQKYPPHTQQTPYSSPYPPPAQPNAAYQQSWTFQQPISPLPKQLSMPPPPALSPMSPSPKPPRILDGPLDPELTDESLDSSDSQDPSPDPAAEGLTPATSSSPPVCPPPCSPSPSSQASQSLPSTPQVSVSPGPGPAPKSQAPSHPNPQPGGWAIWSRRPTDPSLAPGIIISPHSRPPPDVVEKALRIPTPHESPKPVAANLATSASVAVNSDSLSTQAPPAELPKPTLDSTESPHNDLHEPETVSSCGTEISNVTDTPPVPASPLSSNTSVSAAGTASSQTKVGPETSEATTSAAVVANSDPTLSVEVPDSAAVTPSPSADTSTPTPPSAASASTAPVPVSAPPVLKKSWASLLRPAPGDSSTSKSSLPTSSVVGISIPASPPPARVPPVRRAELLALLNGTAPSRYSALPRLRARGIVNSGNMCFANAVLQLLVYSPPFWRLFKELGRLMGQREQGEGQGRGDGATPLVDATVKLLEEFVHEDKKPLPTPTPTQVSRGKAKEEEEKKEEEGVDSFMPTYVYDAMKEKKRFDNMRVCFREPSGVYSQLCRFLGWSSRGCGGILRILP
jgi:ubiquitin carboxyl-terminal hydrolase 10